MIRLRVSSKGIILQAQGEELFDLYKMHASEMTTLPYDLIDPEPLYEGVHNRFCRQRTGESVPVQMAVQRHDDDWVIWAEPMLDESMRLRYLENMFRNLAYVAEYGDPDLSDHMKRVAQFTRFIGGEILNLSKVDVWRFEIAAMVHDVGKTAIPRELLFKPGSYNREERMFMQQHTERGYTILVDVEQRLLEQDKWLIDAELFKHAKDVALYHHENWDGSGYPEKIGDYLIPLPARVAKVVDVIDALITSRAYKVAWPWRDVREQLVMNRATEFDPDLIDALLEHETEFLEIAQKLTVKRQASAIT